MLQNSNILFIVHEATCSGATISILEYLKWLKAHSSLSFKIVLAEGGSLSPEFQKLAPTIIVKTGIFRRSRPIGLLQNHFGILNLVNRHRFYALRAFLENDDIALIYSNTFANGDILDCLSYLKCPVVTHVHELNHLICIFGRNNRRLVCKNTVYYVAAGEMVKRNLLETLHIPEDRIRVIYEAIDTQQFLVSDISNRRFSFRRSLQIPDNAIVIGGCGKLDWRKGADLFIRLADKVITSAIKLPVFFVWAGELTAEFYAYKAYLHSAFKQIKGRILFIGECGDMKDFYASLDIFALTSREDPFPLVVLEAAANGLPITAFEAGGDIGAFIQDDCGLISPQGDTDHMARNIEALINSGELRAVMGEKARAKVVSGYDIHVISPKVHGHMISIIEQGYILRQNCEK